MNILVIHPSFPGQFLYLANYLGRNPENKVYFLAEENNIGVQLAGVKLGLYTKPSEEDMKKVETLGPLSTLGEAMLKGQQAVKAFDYLKSHENFVPDVIVGHTGWGSLLYAKDYYDNVPVLGYFEWYYHSKNGDNFWWPDEVADINQKIGIRMKNSHHILSLEACDKGYTPTKWQYDQLPKEFAYKLSQIHDGIDTVFCSPLPKKPAIDIKDTDGECHLPEGTEVISYVSRGFEAFRGFPQFMDAIRIVLKARPKCHVVIAGTDRVCYGAQLKNTTYKTIEEEKGGYDTSRVHFVGSLNRRNYQNLLRASHCHVYLTRPFILSWSCLEAMSFGLPMVCSKTPPCEEVIEDGVNGMLAEFRSPNHIARKIIELLENRELAEKLGKAARETILERYELNKCLHKQEDLIYSLVR